MIDFMTDQIQEFLKAVCYRPLKEDWATENEVLFEYQTLRLRLFRNPGARKTVLILPPQAGHAGTIADYLPDQSLVRVFLEHGYQVAVTEWLPATEEYRNLGIFDYIRLTDIGIDKVMKAVKARKIALVGQCQGGWQAAIYASLYPEKISGLIVAAAPIDLEAEDSFIGDCSKIPDNCYRMAVQSFNGVMPGGFMLGGFKALQPHEHYFNKYFNIWGLCLREDMQGLERFKRFTNWYESTQNLPGRFYLEAVDWIFRKNSLTHPGSLVIDQRSVDLRNIHCPLVLIGGSKDHITPPGQVFAMERLVSSRRILKLLSPGGHIGTLMGNQSLKEIWPRAMAFLAGTGQAQDKAFH
ncbi:MAG: alpha/beta fold hydrolase [Syntrophaceae bacterium]|nr:alpha/beta fold hydrolase [Syntrophaceae bacterium]